MTASKLPYWVGWGLVVSISNSERMVWVDTPPDDDRIRDRIEGYHGELKAFAQRMIAPTIESASWIRVSPAGPGWDGQVAGQLSPLRFRLKANMLLATVGSDKVDASPGIIRFEIQRTSEDGDPSDLNSTISWLVKTDQATDSCRTFWRWKN